MNTKFRNVLLIGSLFLSAFISSCTSDSKSDKSGLSEDIETGTSGTFTDSRDNKTYKWVKIGKQIWMAENLAYTGSEIKHIEDYAEWIENTNYNGWCYYENNIDNGKTHGVLYQWEAAKIASPDGWHLPTDEEWAQLDNYLKENGYAYDGIIGNEKIAKSLAIDSLWPPSNIKGLIGNIDSLVSSNKTGFSALPSGYRGSRDGAFRTLGIDSYWWSATKFEEKSAYARGLSSNISRMLPYHDQLSNGYSVRCVKDN